MENLTINVSKQFDGFTFSLTPSTRKNIQEEFPSARPVQSIFVAFDVKADFDQLYGRIEKYIPQALTDIPDLSKIENIKYVNSLTNSELHSISHSNVKE